MPSPPPGSPKVAPRTSIAPPCGDQGADGELPGPCLQIGDPVGRVFDDVTPGSTHAGAIAAIAAEGITEGCTRTLYARMNR